MRKFSWFTHLLQSNMKGGQDGNSSPEPRGKNYKAKAMERQHLLSYFQGLLSLISYINSTTNPGLGPPTPDGAHPLSIRKITHRPI